MIHQLNPGDKAKIIQASAHGLSTRKHQVGKIVTVLSQAEASYCPLVNKDLMSHLVSFPDRPGVFRVCPEFLEPLDKEPLAEWSDCIWQPSGRVVL